MKRKFAPQLCHRVLRAAVVCVTFACSTAVDADEAAENAETSSPEPVITKLFADELAGAVPLNPQKTLFLNGKTGKLFVTSTVVLRAGLLEMLCCPNQTKEHESILATPCRPRDVHAGLLALKAEPGKPATFQGEYAPPEGEKLGLVLHWKSAEGKPQQSDARKWIRTATRRYFAAKLEMLPAGLKLPPQGELRYDPREKELLFFGVMSAEQAATFLAYSTDQAFQQAVKTLQTESQPSELAAEWVFVGSQFRADPDSNEPLYVADGGDFICVANFPGAAIDVAIKSSASDAYRGYEAYTERIPEEGTPVLIEIRRAKDVQPAPKP